MLKLMRDYAGSWLIKIILGAIVIVFVFWGVGSFSSQKNIKIASVNQEVITLDDYRPIYNRLINQYRNQFGNTLDDNMIKSLGIKKQAMDQLVDRTLLQQEASNLNFRISDEELAESIKSIPDFQTNGVFDNKKYTKLLTLNRLNPQTFEDSRRQDMILERLNSFILGNVKVSEQEALEWYQWNNASVKIDYALFSPDNYKEIENSEQELEEYFEKNKESYKTEAKVRIQYIHFNPDNYLDKVILTDEDISDYYDSNLDEFTNPKTVEARHILFKADQNSTPEEVEKKKEKADEILKMAKDGKDFAELAKEYSEGPSKDKGGYLGTFKKDAMVKPFSDKAFSMKEGEISEPVQTQFGWHIIKVEKVNEAYTKTLEDASSQIRDKLSRDKSKIIAYEDAQSLYDSAYEDDDLKIIANSRNIEVIETDFFTQDKGPEGLKNSSKFASEAFKLPEMELSKVYDFEDGYYILQVLEKMPREISNFEDVKEKVNSDLIKQKQDEKAKADAEAFLAALISGQDIGSESKKYNIEIKTTDFIKRNAPIPEIGYEKQISQQAFQLSDNTRLPETPIKSSNGYYVISFKEKKMAEPDNFEKEKTSIKERLLRQKQYQTFSKWLGNLKDRSEIIIEDEFLN
ncbi:Peptidyl-prolyl cis-trans isomerase D [Desulfonema limicola]|uniref:Periplasmic chaperone PpiD n=1 Tax=Desulfonema limicola TaxID=45656 RepID=A0A975B5R4_9BACT|nr:SurA N-terminal domain-containing protein [Desulfonema limicola]QTA79313.1 Peptidyl-prolyl cis-trans isomerase D [Desulfonema limicola]